MTNHLTGDQLNSYLHQALTDAEREALGRHLVDCADCRARLNGYETLQRRIRNELFTDLRKINPSPRMSYAAIAPRLKRSRRLMMVLKQSKQFVYGALTMALLVAVGIGLYFFGRNLSQPAPTTLEKVKQMTAVPAVVSQPEIDPMLKVDQPAIDAPGEGDEQRVEFVSKITGDPNPLSGPAGLTLDQQGHLYVIDGKNNRLQVFDATGQFLTMWGSRGSDKGQFNFVTGNDLSSGGVAVDGQGNVYVADASNSRIQKFTSAGQFLTEWGSNGMDDGQFLRALGVAVDRQGNVYVIDDYRNDIQKFDSDGRFLTKWGGIGRGDGQLSIAGRIAVDEQGNVYVADSGNQRVQKFDSNGQFLAKWGSKGTGDSQFLAPLGIAVDGRGYVYVADFDGHNVQKFDNNGQFLAKWGSLGRGDGQLSSPSDVVVDEQGNIYVSDYGNNRIQKFRQQ